MSRRRGSAALLLATLLWGCRGPDHGDPSLLEEAARDSLGVQVQEFHGSALPEATELVLADEAALRIGAVHGVPEEEWTQPVAGARLSDGSLAILEQRPAEIRVFDARGTFLRRIGRPGDGPGELSAPSGMAILPGDTLAVWDPGAARISWFSPDGILAREWSLREPGGFATLRHVALQADGGALLLGASRTMDELANQGRIQEGWEVRSLSPSGEVGQILGTVPGTERIIDLQRDAAGQILTVQIQGRWWWGEGFVWPSPSGVWAAERTRLELRHIHPERGPDRVVRVDVPGRAFTRTLIDSIHGVELERVADPELRARFRDDFALREYPDQVPPVGGVFADAVGRVWVGLLDPPPSQLAPRGLPALRRWLVLEDPGANPLSTPPSADAALPPLRLLGVVTLPPSSHPLYADGEGVVLVRTDQDFGVPWVEWIPFVRP